MPRPPGYGIIYNWDGAPHGYSPHPQSIEQFLEKMYAPMEDTQVGAHFWCMQEAHCEVPQRGDGDRRREWGPQVPQRQRLHI